MVSFQLSLFMKLKQLYFYKHFTWFSGNINLLLAVHEGCTGKYWPKVVAVHNQYSPVQLKQPRLVSSYKMAHKFWICRLSKKKKNTQPVNFFMETVCIAKSLQEKKNQNAEIYLETTLPCNKTYILFSIISLQEGNSNVTYLLCTTFYSVLYRVGSNSF